LKNINKNQLLLAVRKQNAYICLRKSLYELFLYVTFRATKLSSFLILCYLYAVFPS